tara:strand:- start:1477 stop:3096 length:1620 start_codon:yes stop_codon:yes gene_type:complete
MANYYVSATTGNDSNDGSTASLAKATIGAGENLATSAGDVVYIAPGTYREQVVHGYSGTSGNRIYFIGDPEAEHFPGIEPGVVRITACEAVTERADGTATLYIIKSNGKDYITWKNVHVDGGTSGLTAWDDNNNSYGFYANSDADYMECIDCCAQAVETGFRNIGRSIRCTTMNVLNGWHYGYLADKCIAAGCYTGFQYTDKVTNSMAVGSRQRAFYFVPEVINSYGMGSAYFSWDATGTDTYNNISEGCNYHGATYNSTYATQHSGSYTIGANYVSWRYGKYSGMRFGTLNYKTWYNNSQAPTNVDGTTDGSNIFKPTGVILHSHNQLRKLAEVLKPDLYNKPLRNCSYANVVSNLPDTDILDNPRYMGETSGSTYAIGENTHTVSQVDIGPWEFSDVEITGSTPSASSPVFKIVDEGMVTFPLAVSSSQSFTASISLKHDKGSGIGVQPRIILKYSPNDISGSTGSHYAKTMVTGSSLHLKTERFVELGLSNDTWGTLKISSSLPESNRYGREIQFIIHNQQTGSDSITSFSDLEIE